MIKLSQAYLLAKPCPFIKSALALKMPAFKIFPSLTNTKSLKEIILNLQYFYLKGLCKLLNYCISRHIKTF